MVCLNRVMWKNVSISFLRDSYIRDLSSSKMNISLTFSEMIVWVQNYKSLFSSTYFLFNLSITFIDEQQTDLIWLSYRNQSYLPIDEILWCFINHIKFCFHFSPSGSQKYLNFADLCS